MFKSLLQNTRNIILLSCLVIQMYLEKGAFLNFDTEIKAADLQNILENHKLQILQNISSNIYNSC